MNVLIEDNEIASIGKVSEKSDEVIDCSDKIIMPGLINAHTHAAMTLMRGYYDDAELDEWLRKMWSLERRLTPRIIELATKLAIYEMLSHGVTGFIDMYFYPEETARAAAEVGVRALLGPPFIDVLSPRYPLASLRRLESLAGRGALVRPVVNVHSVYTCSEETLLTAREVAEERGLLLHIHAPETRRGVFEVRRRTGRFPVEYMEGLGLLGPRTHLVHLGWVTSWELETIRERGASVAHCPASNMKLATAGFPPVKEMMSMGIKVCLGTDGPATNNSLDMFREMRTAVLMQRNNYWDASFGAWDALRAATVNGGSVTGWRVGRVEEGYEGDLVLVDARALALQPLRRDNVVSALVYSATGADVLATIVRGRVVYMRERDLPRFREEAAAIAAQLNDFLEEVRPR